ncbi:MAG TPA: hypothetical protein VFU49_18350 [Ktedonobacteraceae bacterium]|nr:hypothetical protein [Ktedonobacteraceae bacterium]
MATRFVISTTLLVLLALVVAAVVFYMLGGHIAISAPTSPIPARPHW